MNCKNCGSQIKEGNSFCTNCGKKTNFEEKKVIQKKISIKPINIMVVIIIAVIIALVIFISMKKTSVSSNYNDVIENTGEQVQESKETKIEIGMEYNSITYGTVGYFKLKNETEFFMLTGMENSEAIQMSGNYIIDGDKIKLKVTYDSTLDYTLYDPEATFSMEPYEMEMTLLSDGTIKYVNDANYAIIFDKNSNSHMADATETVPTNLLEQIYAKYPDLKGTEGIICTDGEQYWLLDKNGNKDYFSSVEAFEQSYNKYYGSTSNNSQQQSEQVTNNKNSNISSSTQNSSNNNNNTGSTSNQNDGSVNSTPVNKTVNISSITPEYYPEYKNAKSQLEKSGLIVNEIIEEKNVEFIYMTKQDEWKYQNTQYIYEKGDTVDILHTIYVATESEIRFSVNFGEITDDKNIIPLLSENVLDVGVKVYFDGKFAFEYTGDKATSSSKAHYYSIPANKKIHIKLVADCYIEGNRHEEDKIVNQEYVITEYDLDTTTHKILYYDLYNRESWYFGK